MHFRRSPPTVLSVLVLNLQVDLVNVLNHRQPKLNLYCRLRIIKVCMGNKGLYGNRQRVCFNR